VSTHRNNGVKSRLCLSRRIREGVGVVSLLVLE
jgi:hypothetical protein